MITLTLSFLAIFSIQGATACSLDPQSLSLRCNGLRCTDHNQCASQMCHDPRTYLTIVNDNSIFRTCSSRVECADHVFTNYLRCDGISCEYSS